jgi:hypothetical protein
MCKQEARSNDHAKAAFMVHCMNDPAWTDDLTEADIVAIVEAL